MHVVFIVWKQIYGVYSKIECHRRRRSQHFGLNYELIVVTLSCTRLQLSIRASIIAAGHH